MSRSKVLLGFTPRWLAVLFLAVQCVAPLAIAAAQADAADTAELEAGLVALEGQLEALQGLRAEQPRDRFDLQAVVDQVGTEPAALFAWVVEETSFVPYQGALRGPVGVLMDRRGNSLDRAVLLNDLLTLAGHSTRMVRATLDESTAEDLLGRVDAVPLLSDDTVQPSDEELQSFAVRFGSSAEELRTATLAATAEQQQLAALAAERTQAQSSALLQAVGTESAEDSAANRMQQALALQDHWWVQLEIDGGWQDLDPTLADARPGTAVAAAQQGLVLNELSQLGAQWLQQIDIRVVVEVWDEGDLREEVPLEVTVTPAEHPGQLLVFRQMPSDWPEDLDIFAADNPLETLQTALLDQERWAPTVVMGGEQISQRSFTLAGVFDAASTGSNAAAVGGLGGGGMFGGFGGAVAGEEPANAEVTAEWLEYQLRVPGTDPVVVRRPLFDLLGDEARRQGVPAELELTDAQKLERATALYADIELLPLVGELPSAFVDRLVLETLGANMQRTLELFRGGALDDFDALMEGSQRFLKTSPLYGLALARSVWGSQRNEVYVDRANLIGYHRRLVINSQTGLSMREGFDIVLNSMGVLGDADPFRARLEQGVLDTNAEALLLAGRLPDMEVVNASEFSLSAPVVLTENAGSVPPAIRSLIEADLAAGYVVVLPQTPEGQLAWWRVDPVSGQTLGMGETGWGQAFTEYTEQVNIIIQLESVLGLYKDMGTCLGLAITNPLRGESGPDTELRACVIKLVCKQVDDALSAPFDIDTNWTNIIVQKTIDESYGSICDNIAKRLA
ncbi:MAG: hypothetical protein WD273_11915 [Trueperaceae bacterium]